MQSLSRRVFMGGVAAAAAVGPKRLLAAESVARFYHGNSIRLLIGAAAAGGYDVAGRAVAAAFASHIPGKPSITVENMPGATSLVMTNYLYNGAPRDGSVIGMPNNNILLEPRLHLLSQDGGNAKFDVSRMNWIGTPVQDPQVLWVWRSAANSLDDLRTKAIIMGSTGPGADNYSLPHLVNRILGAKLQVVTGYQGQNDIFIAAERGEVQGNTSGFSDLVSEKADWIRNGSIHILMQFGATRLPTLPDVPTAMELAASEADRDMFRFEALKYAAARPIAMPPDVPPDRVRALQDAFAAAMRDPAYQSVAKKVGLTLNPLNAAEMNEIVKQIDATPQAVVDRLRPILLIKSKR